MPLGRRGQGGRPTPLDEQQAELLAEATARRDDRTADVATLDEAAEAAADRLGPAAVGRRSAPRARRSSAEQSVTVRCLLRPDGGVPDAEDEPGSAWRSSAAQLLIGRPRGAEPAFAGVERRRALYFRWPIRSIAGEGVGSAHAFRFAGAQMTDCRPPTRTDRADRRRPRRRPRSTSSSSRVAAQGHASIAPGGVDMEARGRRPPAAISRALDEDDPDRRALHPRGVEPRARAAPAHAGPLRVGRRPEGRRSRRCPASTATAGSPARSAARDDRAVVIAADPTASIELAYDDIEKARTVFEWGGAEARSGQRRPSANEPRATPAATSSKNQTRTKRAKAS